MQGRKPVEGWAYEESEPDEDDSSEFVSLEELGSVYAKVLQGEPPTLSVSSPAVRDSSSAGEFHGSIMVQGETDGVPLSIWSIIESLLFVGTRDGQAVSLEQLTASMKEFSEAEILQGIEQLQQNLVASNSSVRVSQGEDGYRLSLTPELEAKIEELKWGAPKQAVLSQAAVDCLSLVAYQPGISRTELENQLGQGVGSTIALLQRRGLIIAQDEGYHTTQRFLEIAGIESLEDLPKADEL